MSFKKQYLKSKPVCKVTFRLSKAEADNASEVKLLGSFNSWDKNVEPMQKLKSGDFTAILELPVNQDIEFRYYVDNAYWINDPEAESFTENAFGDHNSVLSTKQ